MCDSISSAKSSSLCFRFPRMSALRAVRAQHATHSGDESAPLGRLASELGAPARSKLVESRLAVVPAHAPRRRDPAFAFEPLKCRIEGTVINEEDLVGG